jgi:hypothetical protein
MAKATIAADLHQTLDVLTGLAAKIALDLDVLVDELTETNDLFLREVPDPGLRVDPGLTQNALARGESDTEYVRQSDLYALLAR